jgi:hypothetical protein
MIPQLGQESQRLVRVRAVARVLDHHFAELPAGLRAAWRPAATSPAAAL